MHTYRLTAQKSVVGDQKIKQTITICPVERQTDRKERERKEGRKKVGGGKEGRRKRKRKGHREMRESAQKHSESQENNGGNIPKGNQDSDAHFSLLLQSTNLPSPQVILFDDVTSIHISQCALNFRILMCWLEIAALWRSA